MEDSASPARSRSHSPSLSPTRPSKNNGHSTKSVRTDSARNIKQKFPMDQGGILLLQATALKPIVVY